jgi:hypothetical protein
MSEPSIRLISSLRVSDLEKYPVWRFANSDETDDTAIQPVKRLPVSTLTGKFVGTRVRLASGDCLWGIVGNFDAKNVEMNEHFVTISIERKGRWFHLARYHDADYAERGPQALARFLGLAIEDIFPISYDVRRFVKGNAAGLTGSISKEPRVRFTRAQIIAMAVPEL